MRAMVAIIIGFLHDFAAGSWAATVLAVWWLDRQPFPPELGLAILGLQQQFFHAGLLCLGLVMATGAGRSFTYVNHVYGAEHEAGRRRLLVGKHLLLLTLFGLGTWWQYTTIHR